MKRNLLIGTAIAVAMNLSYAAETLHSVDQKHDHRIVIAQADATLTGAGSEKADKKQGAGAKSGDAKQQTEVSKADRTFAEKAAEANAREIQLSEMAAEKATSDDVKKYAKQMVDEHGAANKKLMSAINSTIADQWRPKKEAETAKLKEVKNLKALSGEKFDQQYMAMMVKEHSQAVKLYQTQAKSGKTDELKSYANETLPAIQEHLKMAREIEQKVGSGGKSK